MDPSTHKKTLASTLQKDQGRHPDCRLPSSKASLLCGRTSLLSLLFVKIILFPLDTTICANLQSRRTKAGQDPASWYQMDLQHGYPPIGRSPYCRRIRQETLLVRSGTQRKTIQGSQVRNTSTLIQSVLNGPLIRLFRYHSRAIRSVQFHPTYPLFASSSDDGTIQVFHSRVYNDLMTDPLIVPLKILRGHTVTGGLGVLQVAWTPKNPWLVSGGADGVVNVWCS